MKLSISDLVRDCFPEELNPGEPNAAWTARIQERVMKQVQQEEKSRHFSSRKLLATLALAAVLIAALTATAYAAGLFRMHMEEPEPESTVSGTWTFRNEDGSVESQTMKYPDAGFVFTFESDVQPHRVKFRPGWLPDGGSHAANSPDAEGWYDYLHDPGSPTGRQIPYVIHVVYMHAGYTVVLNGDCTVVKEGSFGDYKMKEITSRYAYEYLDDGNYLLLIDEDKGFCLVVSGTNSMEDMEHIARQLEICVTDEIVEYDPDFNIGQINIGRG